MLLLTGALLLSDGVVLLIFGHLFREEKMRSWGKIFVAGGIAALILGVVIRIMLK
jgi:hypothetical protein